MTQEEKKLLMEDICCRIPYEVKVQVFNHGIETVETLYQIDLDGYISTIEGDELKYFYKPYLFPLSSMTEEQKREYNFWKHEVPVGYYEYGDIVEKIELFDSPESFEYLIENHFDYHGLIERGLAIDATGKNIY